MFKFLFSFFVLLFFSAFSWAQTFTISASGETGTSGTNWSITGNTLNVTGTANIQASVIENHLTNTGPLTVDMTTIQNAVVDEVINVNTGGSALSFGTDGNDASVQINSSISINGPLSFFTGHIRVYANLISTANGADILLKTFEHIPGINATDGFLILGPNTDLTTSGGDIILWTNSTNRTAEYGQANNEIVFVGANSLNTSGGRIVLAGGLDDGSNGGTANDGIPDGYAYRGGYTGEAIDIGSNVTFNSGGGEIIIRGEQNGSDVSVGADATFTISNGGSVIIEGENTTATSVNLGTANITSTATNAPVSILGTTHVTNSGLTTITTQGGDVLLASNVDDATDGESVTNGYIRLISGLSITTNGGAITLGGGNATGTAYALGSTASTAEGIRIDGTVILNSGNGNIALRGKSDAVALANEVGGGAIMFYNVINGSINSGTGTLLLDGYSQTTGGNAIAGLLWWNDPTASTFTIQSANTTTSAITLNGYSTSSTGQSYGIEVEATNTLNVYATGTGGGININGGRSQSNTDPIENLDIVFRGPVIILANSGPISVKGGQLGGVSNGYWFTTLQTQIGSAAAGVTSSASDVTIAFDRFWFDGNYFPKLATTGTVTIEPISIGFGMGVSSSWFQYNQNSQTMTGLTLGKAGNTANITHGTNAITVAGPISVYGGDIAVNANLTSTASGADIMLKASGDINQAANIDVTTNGGDVTFWADSDNSGTGYVELNNASIVTNGGDIMIGGGSDPTADAAIGDKGVNIHSGSSLNAGSGAISIRGNSSSTSDFGIGVRVHTATITSGNATFFGEGTTLAAGSNWGVSFEHSTLTASGNVDITGTGGGTTGNGNHGLYYGSSTLNISGSTNMVGNGGLSSGTANFGVQLNASSINGLGSGAMNITGTGNTNASSSDNDGIHIGNTSTVQSGAGTMTLTGTLGPGASSEGIVFFNGANTLGNATNQTGDITLRTDLLGSTGVDVLGTGALTIEPLPAESSFDAAYTFSNITLDANLSGLTLGKASNTANVTIPNAVNIAGPITVYGGDIDVNANLTSTVTNADIVLKASGTVEIQDNTGIETNGGDLILWSNSDNASGGNVLTGQNVTLDSRQGGASTGGGHIHIAGGADTNSDGFPDDATAGIGNFTGGSAYGILFGNAAPSGVQLLSGGGNITLIGGVDGNFNSGANSHGIGFYPGYTVDAGAGSISFTGYGNSGGANTFGIDLMTFGAQNASSISTTGDLTLNGVTTVTTNTNHGIILNTGLTVNAGTVDVTGDSDDAGIILNGSVVSDGAIQLKADLYSFSSGSISGQGTLTIEPLTASNSFSSAFNSSGLTLGSTLTGLTIGKSTNTADVTVGGATTIAGPITIYGGDIAVNENLNTTGGGATGDILLKGSGNIIQASSKSFTTSGGDVTLWADSDDSGAGYIQLTGGSNSGITSGGGNIFLGGGTELATGYARGAAVIDNDPNLMYYIAGVHLRSDTEINSGGGNITLRGQNVGNSDGFVQPGIMGISTTLNAGTGKIALYGLAGGSGSANAQAISNSGSGWTIRSASTEADAITLIGDATTTNNAATSLGINFLGIIEATGNGGGIVLTGASGTTTGYGDGLDIVGDVLAASGTITITGTDDATNTSNRDVFLNNATLGFKTATNVTSSTANVVVRGNRPAFASSVAVNTSGTFTLEPAGDDFSSAITYPITGLTLDAAVSGLTIGKAGNSAPLTIASDIVINGPIYFESGSFIINSNVDLETTAAGADILVKVNDYTPGPNATDGYISFQGDNITTNGGDIILWANASNRSSGSANNEIWLQGSNTLTSNGGKIVLAGGLDDGGASSGLAGLTAGDGIPDGFAYRGNLNSSAVIIDSNVTLLSGGGDVIIRGQSGGTPPNQSPRSFGVLADKGFKLDAGTGTINIRGKSESESAIWLGFTEQAGALSPIAITSASTAANAITIHGESTSATGGHGFIANWDGSTGSHVLIESSGASGGGVSITGITNGANDGIILGQTASNESVQILSQAGDVSLISNAGLLIGNDAFLGNRKDANAVNGITPSVESSSAEILIRANTLNGSGAINVSAAGTLTIEPYGSSFSSAYSTSGLTLGSALTGLTIGKSTNTADVTIAGATTIAGPITLYGANLALNAVLTATSADINLHASGAVTQSAALTANGLGLHGTGTFTLQNAANNIATLAGGDASNRLGNVAYRDADDLEIGSVNPTGLFSSGTILVETENGDLTLSENINTTSTSDDAIILNAGRASSAGTAAGGDIIVSGSPNLTYGSGGRAKLFSGTDSGSTGLTTLVGGSSNVRSGFDEVSQPNDLADDNAYAIYRVSPGTGDLTIVSSGGDAEGSTWSFDSGTRVLTTISSPANVLYSVVEGYLSSGDLTIVAANITVDSDVTSSTGNTFIMKALKNITHNGSKTIQTNAGDVTYWADSDGTDDGTILLNPGTSSNPTAVLTSGGNITMGGGSGATISYTTSDSSLGVHILSSSVLDAGSGNIEIMGVTSNRNSYGVLIEGGTSSRTNISGNDIIIRGQDSRVSATELSSGVRIVFATVAASNLLTIEGRRTTSSTSSTANYRGVVIRDYADISGVNGVEITGHHTGGVRTEGVYLAAYSHIHSSNGPVTINGTGTQYGVRISQSNTAQPFAQVSAHNGDLRLIGAADTAGVLLSDNVKVVATGTGNVRIEGDGQAAGFGVQFIVDASNSPISRPELEAEGDSITIVGLTTSNTNAGIQIDLGTKIHSATTTDILFRADALVYADSAIYTHGTITLEPFGTSFSTPFTWSTPSNSFVATPTGLTIGKSTNTSDVTIGSATTISGPISVYGGTIAINASLNTTGGGAAGDVLLKASSNITQGNSVDITTDGGDVMYWADSDEDNNGHISFGSSGGQDIVTIGGDVYLAGGAGTTVPTGYAHGNSTARGVSLPMGTTRGLINTSNGGGMAGDIIIRGKSTGNFDGIYFENFQLFGHNLTLDGETGNTANYGVRLGSANVYNGTNLSQVIDADNDLTITAVNTAANYAGNALRTGVNPRLYADGNFTLNSSGVLSYTSQQSFININPGKTLTVNFDGTATFTTSLGDPTPSTPQGGLVIQSYQQNSFTTAFSTSAWSFNENLSSLTIGKTTNTADITVASVTSIAGPISIYGGDITVNENLNTAFGGANGEILLKGSGDILLAGSKSIISNGGSVVLWSNSDGTGGADGYILLRDGSSITTNSGNLWMGGGSGTSIWNGIIVGDGYATAGALISSDAFLGSNRSDVASGIYLENTTINTGGGNFAAYGYGDDGGIERGILAIGDLTINTGSGKIYLDAKSNNEISLIFGHHSLYTASENVTLTSSNVANDAITVNSVSSNIGTGWSYGTWVEGTATVQATNGGGIVWTTEGVAKGVNLGYSTNNGIFDLLSNSGDIVLNTKAKGINIQSAGQINLGRKAGTSVTTSSSAITVIGDDFTSSGTNVFNFQTTGAVAINPQTGNSFTNTFNTASLSYSTDISGLTIGHSDNTQDINIGSSTIITGPINLYGGDISIDAALTASGSNINLHASGAVTQTSALTADGLGLNGTGTFTLNNTSNNIVTIAGGNNTNKLASLSYVNSAGLSVGIVNPTGITSSGSIELATLSGDLEVTQPIVSTLTTGDAVKLYADQDESAGNAGDGNIKITGSGSITVESGARALLYSGKESESTGVQQDVGGAQNTRNQIDINTDLSTVTPLIGNTGKYGLFRVPNTIDISTLTIDPIPNYTYSGSSIQPSAVVKDGATTLIQNTDYTLSYVDNLNAGTATITITGIGGYSGQIDVNFEILKATLSITANDQTKVYDGSAYSGGNGVSYSGFVNSETAAVLSGTLTYSGTSQGAIDVGSSYVIIPSGLTSSNYDITYVNGTLTVTSRALEITADSDTKIYDGTALSNTGSSITNGSLVPGHTYTATVTGAQTDVGMSNNLASSAVIMDGSNNDVTANYDITYVNGTLTITSRALEITADSDTKIYDGTALSNTGSSITNGSLVSSHTYTATVTGAQMDLGTSNNVASSAVIRDGLNNDVTANYNITYVNGTLAVTARPLEITANTVNKTEGEVYVFTNTEYSITNGTSLAPNQTVSLSLSSPGALASAQDGIYSITISNVMITDAGNNNVTANYQITANTGNFTVTARPVAQVKSLTVALGSNNLVSLQANQFDSLSYIPYGNGLFYAQTTSGDPLTFDCSDVGVQNIMVVVTDDATNLTDTAYTTVTIVDNVPPSLTNTPSNMTVSNDVGNCGAVVTYSLPNIVDNCLSSNLTLVQTTGIASGLQFPVGTTTNTFVVTDGSGNTDTSSFDVTVNDTEAPVVNCPADITLTTSAACGDVATFSVTGSDNCTSSGDLQIVQTAGLASGSTFPVGVTTNTFTVTDTAGNSTTCSFTVTVIDNGVPTIVANDQTVYLDANGQASITAAQVGAGSGDLCSQLTLTLSDSLFDCGDLHPNTSNLTFQQAFPNISLTGLTGSTSGWSPHVWNLDSYLNGTDPLDSVTFTFNAKDQGWGGTGANATFRINGVVIGRAKLLHGFQSFTLEYTGSIPVLPSGNQMTMHFVGWPGWSSSLNSGNLTMSYTNYPIVTLTATDTSGNSSTATAQITILDTISPVLTQVSDVAIASSGSDCGEGYVFGLPSATDNCSQVTVTQIGGPLSGDIFPLGTTTLTFEAADGSGNTSSMSYDVVVTDGTPPTAICQDFTLVLDPTGNATLSPSDIDNGSYDNCATTVGLSLDRTSFDCTDVGQHTVTLTVTDTSGNSSTCQATVTVVDNTPPVALCQPITLSLDASGVADLTVTSLDAGSTDACGIASFAISGGVTQFTCADIGVQTVELIVTDVNGNTSICTTQVTVVDEIAPVAVCQDLTIYTDASGNASISDVSLLDGGSSDNCGIVDYQVSQVNFTCADIGANVVDFIVLDASGNSDTCQATVTVVDQTAPVAQCVDLDVYLDVQGLASITTGSVYQSITDNCAGVDTAYLSQYDFSCSDVGSNTVTLTVSDIYGNTSTCDFTVTVIDTVSPVVQCQDRVLSLDAQTGLADLADLGLVGNVIIYMTDNCGIATTAVDKTLFDCSDIGTYMLTATVTDVNGNVSTCTSTITIEDATAPLVSCQPATLSLGGQGSATLSPSAVIASSSDACGIDSSWTIPSEFTCADLGDQPVTVYVRDNGGNVSSCTTVVTVVDDQAPVWNCPGTTLTVNLSDAASITGIDWTSYVTDNCGTPVVTTSLGTIDCQLVGTTSVTITATDASGNSSTCQTTLEVVDDIAPVIACPVDVTIQTNGQQCQAVADWTLPTGSDNCDGNPAITQIAGPMKGSMQPTGSYTVSYEVMDASGNADTCSFVVTIEDLTAPAFLGCPTNQVLYSTMADCDRTASWTAPTAADACGTTPVVQTQGLPSGSMFPVGTTYIEYVATDASGNNDTCGFTITVIDQIAPIVSCPLPQVVSADAGQCGATVSWSAPGATDNCGVANVQRIDNLPVQSGDFLAVGTYVLTYQYTDASGNSSVCSKVIVVEDREAPVLSCSSDFTQSADSGLCSAVVTYNTPTATDNCDQALSVTQIAGLASGSTFPVGTTTNTFVVTDNAGNSDTCSFDVTVIDQSTPVISCLADIVASADTGSCTAIVTYTPPTATTSCGGVISTQQIEGLSSGSAFPLGVTVNTFVAIGLNGQNDTCSFTVTVEDVSAPVFTVCPSDQELFSTSISCDRVASWTAPVAQDNCGGVTVVQTQGPVSGSSFAPGVTLIEYTATDGSGNSSTCSFTITVTDQVDPQVSCPAPMVLESDPVQCGAIVNWTIPSATDNCGIDTIVRIDNEPFDMGDFVPVGTYVVSYEYIDVNGNSTVCNMAIEVEDNQPPVLTCPSDVVQSSDNGLCSAVVNYTVPSAVDNCSQVSAVVQIAGLPSGGMFPIGVTTNTFVVSDDQGNSDTCSFTVTITDSEAPMLACPADLTVQAVTGSCDATVTYNLPTATDNCDQSPTVMQIAGLASGSTFPVGVTTNTFVATDSNGNSDTCSFTVTVEEMTPPVLSCAQDVYALADAGSCDAVVNYTAPTVFDNCDANPTVTQISGLPSGSTFPIGVTTNTFVAVDFSGNSDTCSFTVTVEDDQAPVVSCPSDISQSNDPGSCGAVVSYALPTGVDNCSGSVTVTQTSGLASGSTFPVGVTTNTFTLTDGNGNSTTCSFTVTVVDTQSPVITCPLDITQSNDPGLCGATVSYGLPTVSGNCSGNLSITQTAGLSSGSFFPVGSTVNTFVVTDAAGNSSSCSFTVTVNDTEAPVVSCPADITTSSVSGVCGAPVSFTGPVVLQSNCSGVSIQRTDNTGLNSGDVFPIGVTTLTWSITDASGNSTSCSQTITVTDIVAPTVSCPANITVGNDPGSCSAVVNYTAPTGTDNCGSVTVTQTGGLPSGSSFPVGTTVNTFTVSDGSGNSSTCSFTVTVNDTEAPTISCPSNITTTSQFSQCGEIVTYTAPTVTDNCSGNLSIQQTAGLASGSLFPVGTTTNTFVVTDGSGNTATCSFTVTVQQGFTVTLPNDTAHCGPYTLSAALVTGGQYLWSTGSVSPTITITQSGTYSVTVTNSGGCVDSDQINVTINTPPTASIVGLNNFYCVYDASISLVGTPAGGSFSGPGVSGGNFDPAQAGNGNHVITYSYTDNNGCTATASQSLTVSECVSLEEQWIETVSVYPNPFSSSFEVVFMGNSTEAMTMELTDMTGRIIYSETVYPQVGENRYQITPEHLAASVYYLTLRQGETITTEKLVKGK